MRVEIVKNKRVYEVKAFVESESEDGKFYYVSSFDDIWGCTCPYNTNRGVECKHIRAVMEEIKE